MSIDTESLAIDFFPRVGYASHEVRSEAWNQFRRAAAQLQHHPGWRNATDPAAAVTASLHWSDEDAGWLATSPAGDTEIIAWLDFAAASLWIERRAPQEGSWIELEGRDPSQIGAWIATTVGRLADAGSAPACEAPVADTAQRDGALGFPDADALADLEALYEGAGLLLGVMAESFDADRGSFGRPLLRASDLVAEACLSPNGSDSNVSIGLSPPDEHESTGYWFVRSPVPLSSTPSTSLERGRWFTEMPGAVSAILPIAELTEQNDGDTQCRCLVRFIASAIEAITGLRAE
jgi:hypothetical protein